MLKTSDMKVYCRFRPPTIAEHSSFVNSSSLVAENFFFSKDQKTVRYTNEANVFSGTNNKKKSYLDFSFNKVFQPTVSQHQFYSETVKDLVSDLFAGFNCSIIAYGQTGSGKTYTMLGDGLSRGGVVPNITKDIFERIKHQDADVEVFLSGAEIYLEKIYDILLKPDGKRNSLKIRHSTTQKLPFVENLAQIKVTSTQEVLKLIEESQKNKITSSTLMNRYSSRGHSVYTMNFIIRKHNGEVLKPSLVLVDLAGSEHSKKSGVLTNAIVFQETKLINKSLSSLGNVIKALSENKNFIPYRNSKLTRILQSSVGGNAKTCFILTCSSSKKDISETLSTLRFGKRAAGITNHANLNIMKKSNINEAEVAALKSKVLKLEKTNQSLMKQQMEAQVTINKLKAQSLKYEKQKAAEVACKKNPSEHIYKPRSISARSMSILSPTRISRYSSGKIEQNEKSINSINLPELDVSFASSPKLETDTTSSIVHFERQLGSPVVDRNMENALVELTKKMISLQTELTRKNEELERTKLLLQPKGHKTRFGFIRHNNRVETRQFAEVVKKKDDNIEELTMELSETRSQLNFLNTKYSALEVEKKTFEAQVLKNKGRIRFLEEALEQQVK